MTLPAEPQIGMSSTWIIYATNLNSGTAATAVGQIFTPPREAPTLKRLGFWLRQDNPDGLRPSVRVQVMLAEWAVDRPAAVELWASRILTLEPIEQSEKFAWQDFDLPEIRLSPEREYIAWFTLSDLGNPPDATIGIPDMGPRYRTSPVTDADAKPIHTYAQGRAAFFREANPGGTRDDMTGLPWVVSPAGHNIYFRMLFEENL